MENKAGWQGDKERPLCQGDSDLEWQWVEQVKIWRQCPKEWARVLFKEQKAAKYGWRRKNRRERKRRRGQKSRKRTDSVQTRRPEQGVWILSHRPGEVVWGFKHGSEIIWFVFSTSVLKSSVEWQSIFKTGNLREGAGCQEAADLSPEWG